MIINTIANERNIKGTWSNFTFELLCNFEDFDVMKSANLHPIYASPLCTKTQWGSTTKVKIDIPGS